MEGNVRPGGEGEHFPNWEFFIARFFISWGHEGMESTFWAQYLLWWDFSCWSSKGIIPENSQLCSVSEWDNFKPFGTKRFYWPVCLLLGWGGSLLLIPFRFPISMIREWRLDLWEPDCFLGHLFWWNITCQCSQPALFLLLWKSFRFPGTKWLPGQISDTVISS